MTIPVMRPKLPRAEAALPYLRRMDDARVYANFGPLNEELERRYADRFSVDASQVVTCANATLALQGAAAVSAASHFHVPAWTFAATPLAVVGAGLSLSFCDIRQDDWQIEVPVRVRGEGLMPVLPFGAELVGDHWMDWSEVIVDAAASAGMVGRDLSWLPPGWVVVFSLHATKVLGIGEGAVVVFGDPDRARRFGEYTVLGFSDRRESDFVGTNAKLSEMAAAYGLAALDEWASELVEWQAARSLAAEAERTLGIGSVCSTYPGVSPYWIVDLGAADRAAACVDALTFAGIGTRRWWPMPCTRMRAFAGEWGRLPTPVSDRLSVTTVGLPFFRDLTTSDVERIVDELSEQLWRPDQES